MTKEYTAKIQKIFFQSPEGYIIAGTNKGTTVKGTVQHSIDDLVGVEISFSGDYVENKKFNRMDFEFKTYTMKINFSEFFLTKIVKIPAQSVKEATKRFGDKLPFIIENAPEKLLDIKGVGEKKLDKIKEEFKKNKKIHELAEFLAPHGITIHYINKIQDHFDKKKKHPVVELKKNPYVLIAIARTGFLKADSIARKLGHKPDSEFRIVNGIVYALTDHITNNGHTYASRDEIFYNTKQIIDIHDKNKISNEEPLFSLNKEMFDRCFEIAIDEEKIVLPYNNIATTPKILRYEKYIYDIMRTYGNKEQSSIMSEEEVEQYIKDREKQNGFKFGEKQKDAIRLANKRYPIFYIYGLAGSGKTTVSKDALYIYEKAFGKNGIVVTSLSGVAANRAKNVTGFNGGTIHSLLQYGKTGGFEYNESNKLPYSVIMLDECSMVDSELFYHLISAIDFSKTTLMLVGDPGQLQSIGPGDVYKNIIESGMCYGVGLDKVFRQSSDQVINVFATEYIRKGKMLPNPEDSYADFSFRKRDIKNGPVLKKTLPTAEWDNIRKMNYSKILDDIKEKALSARNTLYAAIKKKDIYTYLFHFQVISPQKGGMLGVEYLNTELQKIINPFYGKTKKIENAKNTFFILDKVIHLKNDNRIAIKRNQYQKERDRFIKMGKIDDQSKTRVYNGQMGVLSDIFEVDGKPVVAVTYPNEGYITLYTKNDFDKGVISLNYAMSIHKSQGSEFENVVFPATTAHYMMLNNQLFYTAFTRAKNNLFVVGESFALKRGCTNVMDVKRNTLLNLMIQENGKEKGIQIESTIDQNTIPPADLSNKNGGSIFLS